MPSSMNRTDDRFHPTARAAAALAGLLLCASTSLAGDSPLVPGELILRAENPKQLAAATVALSAQFADVGVIDSIQGRPIYLLSYSLDATQTADDAHAALDALTAAGVVTWAELNYEGRSGEGQTDSLWLSGLAFPPDAFEAQYAADLLGLDAAHARSRGQGVTIAIVDTGIDGTHPIFGGRVSPIGASFVAGSPSASDIGDGVDNDADGLVDEQVGHGTFVAGLVHLVAPEAKLLSARVLDSEGRASTYAITKALAWSIDRGAHIVNMSLGETYRSQTLEDVVEEAMSKGIVVVGAAGNSATEEPEEFPACDGSACGVSALDADDIRGDFSSFGAKIDLAAPGVTDFVGKNPVLARAIVGPIPGGGLAVWQGTSFATAFVSGTMALVRAQHPEWPSADVPASGILDTMLATLGSTGVAIDKINPMYAGMLGTARISASGAALAGPIASPAEDLTLDGDVDAVDLAAILIGWGPCEPGERADFNGDGLVDAADVTRVLLAW